MRNGALARGISTEREAWNAKACAEARDHAEVEAVAARAERLRKRAYQRQYRIDTRSTLSASERMGFRAAGLHGPGFVRVPPEVEADRALREDAAQALTPNQIVLGDPPPGRSARDKRGAP